MTSGGSDPLSLIDPSRVWQGVLGYNGADVDRVVITELRVFEGSIRVVGASATTAWGEWNFDSRLLDRGLEKHFRYEAKNQTAMQQSERSDPFDLAMSLRRIACGRRLA